MLAGPRALRRSDRRRRGSSTSPWRARDVRVAPACDDGAGHWLSELDPEGEIAGLPAVVREEQIGGSAAWPDDYIVVRGWSEGTALLYEAIQEADDEDRVKAAFQARLGNAARGLGAADAKQRACSEGLRKRRFAELRGDSDGLAARPGAGDDPDHGVCL